MSQRHLVALLDGLVADWSRARPDIDLSTKQVVFALYIVAELLRRNADEVLAPWQLSFNSFGVLTTLIRGGEPYERSSGELAHALGFTAGGMSNMLRRLERLGYISRTRSTTDARGVRVRLTETGIRVTEEALPLVASSEAKRLRAMDVAGQRQLYRALRAVIGSFASG